VSKKTLKELIMKFFIKILCITTIALHNQSVNARSAGGTKAKQAPVRKQTPTPKQQPTRQPVRPVQSTQQQTYKDLVALVKSSKNAWDPAKKMLNNNFIDTVITKARELNLESFQLEALLKTARDMHGVFSGNQNNDIAILKSVEQQITHAVQQL
jgi:hypothetical protein